MPFTVPAFPLRVNVWRGTTSGGGAPTFSTVGNLRCSSRYPIYAPAIWPYTTMPISRLLLLPKGTDVRGHWAFAPDFVEVPAGSGRKYTVEDVDDIAKGFSNEYRIASIGWAVGWPVPTPLP